MICHCRTSNGATPTFPDQSACVVVPVKPNCEYIRMANIKIDAANLKDYKVKNCETGEEIKLPDCIVPPGRTVRIHSGKGINQINAKNQELIIFLGKTKEIWKDSGSKLILLGPNGIEDQDISKKDFSCSN